MKTRISSILIIFSLSLLIACSKSKSPSGDILQKKVVPKVDAHNSANSVDWNGTYIGTLPCADCEGIKTSIRLNPDLSYQIKTQYIGKNVKSFEQQGTFKWNDTGKVIVLDGKENSSIQYLVGENTLLQLDKNGKKITGEFSERYILKKITIEEENLVGKNWKLVELNGNFIKDSIGRREMFIYFDPVNQSMNGFAGCNNFFGSYRLAEFNGLTFSKIGSTRMACMDVTVEDEFFNMLAMVDNYSVNGNLLMLQKAKAPLAKFEIIEKK